MSEDFRETDGRLASAVRTDDLTPREGAAADRIRMAQQKIIETAEFGPRLTDLDRRQKAARAANARSAK